MSRWNKALGLLAVMASVSGALVGCTAVDTVPSASLSSASVESPQSSVSSSTPSPVVQPAAIVVGMEGLTVVDAAGRVIEELSYRAPGIDVAGRLTDIFGVTPVQTEFGGSYEAWPSRNYDWAGFMMFDEMRDDPAKVVWYDFVVRVSVATVNGIEIRTASGARVGDPESVVQYDPSDRYRYEWDGQSCGVESWFSPTGNIDDAVYLHICSSTETGLVEFFDVPAQLQV